ncbi:MAG: hypothetical protein OEU92_17810 [Alphaproteobacteria bacterium]|nr:hypothetical protein [Alphaproteobacteria bacterium]
MSAREDAFGHLDLSRKLAAASRDFAVDNPDLAHELADESRALLELVMGADVAAEDDDGRAPAELVLHDDADAPCFRRFRAMQKQIVPPPDFGPFIERGEQPSTWSRLLRRFLPAEETCDNTDGPKRRAARSA